MRYYIIAGERSGDMHGGNLVRAIRHYDPEAEFRGFGGENMQAAGVTLSVHYAELAFMGMVEIVTNLNKIARYSKKCKSDILQYKPDVVVLIDYGGFNLRIAKFATANNVRVFFYIAPKVWAWYQSRAEVLRQNVNRMFVILPFEKPFFKKFNWDVDYVGNPVLDSVKAHVRDKDFLAKHAITNNGGMVALLPGSRKQELTRITPLLVEIVKRFPTRQFAVAAVNNLDAKLYDTLRKFPNVTFVFEDTYNLLQHAEAAIVTSGTATLETALFRVPQIVVYRTSTVSYWIGKWLVKVKFISLVNLIAGREVVKELIQGNSHPDRVAAELKRILSEPAYRDKMIRDYDEIISILDTGSASDNAGRLMVEDLTALRKLAKLPI